MSIDYKQLVSTAVEHLKPAARELIASYGDGELSREEAIEVVIKLWPIGMGHAAGLPIPNKGGESKRSLVADAIGALAEEVLARDNPWIPNWIERPLDRLIIAALVVLSDVLYAAGIGHAVRNA